MAEYAALSKTPYALADGLMLVFQPLLIINSSDNSQLPLRPLRDKPGSARAAGSPAGPTSAAPLAVSHAGLTFSRPTIK